MADFKLSEYQEKILNFFLTHPHDNILVNALAGCAKSSTICLLTEHTTTSDIYLAFNNSVAEEFRQKIKNPKTKVSTIHALAYGIMNANLEDKSSTGGFGKRSFRADLDNLKIYKIVEDYFASYDFLEKVFLKENYVSLYNLVRLTMTDINNADEIERLIDCHSLFFDFEHNFKRPSKQEVASVIKYINQQDWELFDKFHSIDFTDMTYITYWKIKNKEWKVPYYKRYTNIYLDEVQDNNRLQQAYLPLIKRKGGRYVIVQDKNQAIYFFSGADANACKRYSTMFSPITEFELPICYRCPVSHLTKVNKEFGIPILPRENAPAGEIQRIEKDEISKYIKGGDLVISRLNKWLAPVILNLVSNGISVYISDKEFVENIKKVVTKKQKVCRDTFDLENRLKKEVTKYNEKVFKILKSNIYTDEAKTPLSLEEQAATVADSNSKIDNINFVLSVLNYYNRTIGVTSLVKFLNYLTTLLNIYPNNNCVRLNSVHKAKGLEADNVFVLNEGKICRDVRNSPEMQQQEKNLSYISLTRAKNKMYLVKEPTAQNKK